MSRGEAPRPRAAPSAVAPVSPTCMPMIVSVVKAGSAPAPPHRRQAAARLLSWLRYGCVWCLVTKAWLLEDAQLLER